MANQKTILKIYIVKLTFSIHNNEQVYYIGNRNSVTTFDKAKVFSESEYNKFKFNKIELIEKLFNKNTFFTSGNLMEEFNLKVSGVSSTLINQCEEPDQITFNKLNK